MSKNYLLKGDKLQCRVLPVTRVSQNCSLLWCLETARAAIVDPGGDTDQLLQAIDEEQVDVERILITHPHPDHAGAAAHADRFVKDIVNPAIHTWQVTAA